ncbi:MAG: hypothetical protein ACYC5J_06195, partial [Chloroflexota bacterium]
GGPGLRAGAGGRRRPPAGHRKVNWERAVEGHRVRNPGMPSVGGAWRLVVIAALVLVGAAGSSLALSRYARGPGDETAASAQAEGGLGQGLAKGVAQVKAAPEPREDVALPARQVADPTTVETKWGFRVVRLAVVAGGGLVDLRFEILDPNKADPVLNPSQAVLLLDEASGRTVGTARFSKIGELRQRPTAWETGKLYYMGFSNSGGLIKPGSSVSLIVGDYRLEHLVVRGGVGAGHPDREWIDESG